MAGEAHSDTERRVISLRQLSFL